MKHWRIKAYLTRALPLVLVPSGNIRSWGQPFSEHLCFINSTVLFFASWSSLLTQTADNKLPMYICRSRYKRLHYLTYNYFLPILPNTGIFVSSYFATGHEYVKTMLQCFMILLRRHFIFCIYLTQSRRVEWGATTRMGASSTPTWSPFLWMYLVTLILPEKF